MQIEENMEKCHYFDKGYWKLKSKCLKNHSFSDFKGQFQDKKKHVHPDTGLSVKMGVNAYTKHQNVVSFCDTWHRGGG